MKQACITNNRLWLESEHSSKPHFELIAGKPLDVFLKARDYVHLGWRFINHPLYGNFHPAVMPYRTLLLELDPDNKAIVDLLSVDLLEKSLALFREIIVERASSGEIMNDYAIVDRELMKETPEKHYSGGMT